MMKSLGVVCILYILYPIDALKKETLDAAEIVKTARKTSARSGDLGAHGDLTANVNNPVRLLVTGEQPALDQIGRHPIIQSVEAAFKGSNVPLFRGAKNKPSLNKYTMYNNVGILTVDVDGSTPDETIISVIEKLQAEGSVHTVEPDTSVRSDRAQSAAKGERNIPAASDQPERNTTALQSAEVESLPNDTRVDEQWGLLDIEAFAAWSRADLPSNFYKPKVVVIGSGVDYTHEDLSMNAFVNEGELFGDDDIDNDGNGYPGDVYGWNAVASNGYPLDEADGSGTLSAGVMGAMTNNKLGIAGVHYGMTLVPCKALEGGEGVISEVISCIDYAIAVEADVLISLYGSSYMSFALMASMMKASNRGITLVATAGDSQADLSTEPYYPCAFDHIDSLLCVGAIDQFGDMSATSSYGTGLVRLAAPGVEILSTHTNQTYLSESGTDMAASFVAGAAAFLKSVNSSLRSIDVLDILLGSAVPFNNWEIKVGHGKLNLDAAVVLALTPEHSPTTTTTTSAQTGSQTSTSTQTTTHSATYTSTKTPLVSLRAVPALTEWTCEEGCSKYGGICDETKTTLINTDLNDCFDFVSQSGEAEFGKGSEVDVADLPYGCQTTEALTVILNTNQYGSGARGCRSAAARTPSGSRICACSGM